MFLKNLFTLWHFAIFIAILINQSLGSEDLIKRDVSLDRNNVPKNILVTSMVGRSRIQRNYTAQSIYYRSIPQVIFENDYIGLDSKSSEVNKAFLEDGYEKLLAKVRKISVQSYVPFYNIYTKVAEEINADLFFCDILMNYPCFDLAWKLGKPAVGIDCGFSLIKPPPSYMSDPIHGCHANMENESFYNRFRCEILVPLKLTWKVRSTIKGLNAQRAIVDVEPHDNMFGRTSNTLMLSNSFYGFEIPHANSPLYQEIGPVLPDTFPSLTPTLESFLTNHPRTIYFALGTIVFISPQNVITLLKSFLELINQDVIDGVIWSTVRTDTSDSLQLANSSAQISSILNNNHPHIHVSKYSPQYAILSHENTRVFLSHGGASSSHESMYTATPMLVLPIMGDQPSNAEKLELAGMALRISKWDLNVNDIVSKVKRLLNEESFKKNAERLQFLAKVNSKRKYRAADLIEIVLNTVKYEGVEDENGRFKINNENLLRDWITPDLRMGFIRGKYLDVYAVAIILFLVLCGVFGYALWKIARYTYIRFSENRISQKHLKRKGE
ncbi:16039_t:CDS:2 [Cetraspora pellucida]|uniref:16039_t:CDS:1 n=1 Tax=Cetraspora pellucida TaxID=1433469 RepID=A0A9N9NI10_9GLOM|nr:16039_t:CDS:2 [Cetraspora pellucida]